MALAVLIATAGLAVLVAIMTGQAWPPVVVAIIGTCPALYLAFLAVPGVVNPTEVATKTKPVFGRPVGWWNPVDLGVHKVIGGGPLPPYVLRMHDDVLTAVLDPGVPASRLVVIRGGSSTGKTRAAWEAVVRGQFAGWPLDYPRDPAALKERLDVGVPPRTVLWLGELRQAFWLLPSAIGAPIITRAILRARHVPSDFGTRQVECRPGHDSLS